ncbi:hypothetical protein MKX01_034537, partial [Papaver californicum]
MDAKGLLNYIKENRKYMDAVRAEIPVALKSAPEPAHLVLDLLKGIYPSPGPATFRVQESRRDSEDRECIHRSCLMLIESVAPLVLGGDELVDHKTKRRAKIDEEELCKLVLAVSHRLHIPDLFLSLGLTDKIPVVVEALISHGRQIDAVHFVQAFKLDESFPPA